MAHNMSEVFPSWLPPLAECSDLTQWQLYEDSLYKIYLEDLFRHTPLFLGKPVKTKYYPPYKNKAFSFWHLTHEGKNEDERIPDMRRCERISWIKPLIEHCEEIYYWSRPDKDGRYYIWFEQGQFLIVLQPKVDYFFLVTAYQVEYQKKALEYTEEAKKYMLIK